MNNLYSRINDSFLSFIENNPDKRKFVFYGGSGSGKSVFIAMFICIRFLTGQNENILVLRKWLPALKISALKLILDILISWGFDADANLNKSDLILKFGTNRIYFSGLDNPEKIKSAEFTYIWIEEATDLDREDYLQLTLRLGRAKHTAESKILMSFNPIDQYHWLIQDVIEHPDDTTAICHSTYLDNYDNLSAAFIKDLEDLINKDENYYRVYTLGLPGVLKNIIYTNYTIQNVEMPSHPQLYGLDFGFNNPMALIEVAFRDDSVRVHERFYERGKTTDDLIKWMDKNKISKTAPMYADSAEPDRIEQIRKAGYNVHPAKKDVAAGIDYVKSLNLVITSSSSNVIGEIRTYKYMERKDGSVIDEPVPFNDHALDALRYALFTRYFNNTQVKSDSIPKRKQKNPRGGFT
jgi:phage terminase large subunit